MGARVNSGSIRLPMTEVPGARGGDSPRHAVDPVSIPHDRLLRFRRSHRLGPDHALEVETRVRTPLRLPSKDAGQRPYSPSDRRQRRSAAKKIDSGGQIPPDPARRWCRQRVARMCLTTATTDRPATRHGTDRWLDRPAPRCWPDRPSTIERRPRHSRRRTEVIPRDVRTVGRWLGVRHEYHVAAAPCTHRWGRARASILLPWRRRPDRTALLMPCCDDHRDELLENASWAASWATVARRNSRRHARVASSASLGVATRI